MESDKNKSSRWSQFTDSFTTSLDTLNLFWKTDRSLFLIMFVSVTIPAITPFLVAYVFKLIIDLVVFSITHQNIDQVGLLRLFGLLFLIQFANRMMNSLQNYVIKIFFIKFPIKVQEIVLNKVITLDLYYFEDSNFRDLLQKVRDSYFYRPQELINQVFFLYQSFLSFTIALFALVHLNVFLGLIILIVAIPDFFNQVYFSKFSWGIYNQSTPQRKKFFYLSNLIQSRESIKELKIFQTAVRFLKDLKETQVEFIKQNQAIAKRQIKFNGLFNFLNTAAVLGIAYFVVMEAVLKRITVGDISYYQTVISNFNEGIGGVFRATNRVFDHALYTKAIFELLNLEPKITMIDKPIKIDSDKTPIIEFKNVSFTYPGSSVQVLKNLSLVIKPGEKVAFVGENGAGKTTLIKLLARFYDVDKGQILIDGVDIKELDLESWYKAIGVLFQDFIHYEYPAKDNIFFGRVWEEENLDKIIDAAKGAGAHEMIKKFDQEYEQMLGKTFEGGEELSGGQWQKIALARAFFRNAPVLILDEPTASIDAKAESEIFNRVEKLSKDKTVIIISHRFSTVRNADKIYVIDDGRIVESGEHRQLMKLNGQYATLFNLQAKGYK